MTFVVYNALPPFPATDQNPNCVRYQIGSLWVDTDNSTPPTQADVDAFYAPGIAQQARISAVRLNARRQALITAIQNNDDVGLIAAAQARYPSLTGDAAKFAADVILLIAGQIRS